MELCGQFYLAGSQAPTKASLALPFLAGQRREKIMKGSGVQIGQGEIPPPSLSWENQTRAGEMGWIH